MGFCLCGKEVRGRSLYCEDCKGGRREAARRRHEEKRGLVRALKRIRGIADKKIEENTSKTGEKQKSSGKHT